MLSMFLNGLSREEITYKQPFSQAATSQLPVPVEEVTGHYSVSFCEHKAF